MFPLSSIVHLREYGQSFYLSKNGMRYMYNFSEIIMLKYPYNGETKSGIIRLNFRLNSEEPGKEYISIEYGDQDIQSYVQNNPSVRTQVESLRNKWKP